MEYSNHDGAAAFFGGSMDLPDESDSTWRRVILGEVEHEFEFLALRILLARLNVWGKADESPERMRDCVRELRGLLQKSARVPSARRDVERMFGSRRNA